MIIHRKNLLKKVFSFCGSTRRMLATGTADEVLFETKNRCGIITLNKPKTLNAINLSMVKEILKHLEAWENSMSMVIIRGVGRAFCAGGDIKYAISGGVENTTPGKSFFRTEYTMNHKIGTYRLPYIALIDGITMGGGVGLSVHGRYRVATEKTMFAMPETAIGLFPDVGASYFLPRLPGQIGMFLALTGNRLIGADCLKIGIATHYCDSKDIPQLFDALIETQGDIPSIDQTLSKFSKNTDNIPFSLEDKIDLINRIFGLPTVEEILNALSKEGSSWSKEILESLKKMSPTSLKISHKEFLLGKSLGLHECLQMENRLAGAALEGRISKDFYEGVRAVLIDKDKNPKWSPAKLEEITDPMVQSCFSPLSVEEEFHV
uniref:3-hydroxyisobutyryl-CoA hydrolase, mitochondrial n=1 Tax=Riptortus pedestris TaxID=329032 RepID=R4WIQ7_RIPPE|nr:crotonobetainyl-CoA-hydratase, putative [Riptortus pedestris]